MSNLIGISTPTIRVNGNVVSILPNSFEYTGGYGEKTVRTFSAGGDRVVNVTTQNAETFKSMVKFSLSNTSETSGLIRDWSTLDGQISIEVAHPNFQASFRNMTMTVDPSIPFSNDGTVEVEFEGTRVVIGN